MSNEYVLRVTGGAVVISVIALKTGVGTGETSTGVAIVVGRTHSEAVAVEEQQGLRAGEADSGRGTRNAGQTAFDTAAVQCAAEVTQLAVRETAARSEDREETNAA